MSIKRNDLMPLNFDDYRWLFLLEPYEYVQGFRISLYADLKVMRDVAEAINQNRFCNFPNEAYSIAIHDFKFLKNPVDKYKINLRCLFEFISLLQADLEKQHYTFRKEPPWGSNNIIPDDTGRLDIAISLVGGKSYAFQFQSRWMDLPKEPSHLQVLSLLEDTYEAVKQEIKSE